MGTSLALVGCGAIGSALLKGWLTLSDFETRFKKMWVIAPHREKVEPFLQNAHVEWLSSPQGLSQTPDIIVLAVKPFLLAEVLPLYKSFPSLFISVASGKSLAFYENFLPAPLSLIRAMPNTPVCIHKGVIGLLSNTSVTVEQKNLAEKCFNGLGFYTWLQSDEDIDKMTAISGSGPAYVFFLIEALAQAAEALGFSKGIAINLALTTFWGASTYAHESDLLPDELRRHVTSTKGTTAAALNVLETKGLHNLMKEAVKAAYLRAVELRQ